MKYLLIMVCLILSSCNVTNRGELEFKDFEKYIDREAFDSLQKERQESRSRNISDLRIETNLNLKYLIKMVESLHYEIQQLKLEQR